MKMTVIAITQTNIQGTSKKGQPYHIDQTSLTVAVPFDTDDGFGVKVTDYTVGRSSEFVKYAPLRGRLPVELDITLGVDVNQYGQPVTVVTDVKLPSVVKD